MAEVVFPLLTFVIPVDLLDLPLLVFAVELVLIDPVVVVLEVVFEHPLKDVEAQLVLPLFPVA